MSGQKGFVRLYADKECTEPFDLDFGEVEQGSSKTLIRYMCNEGDRTPENFEIRVADPELKVDYEDNPEPGEVYPVVFEWAPTEKRGQTGLIPVFIDVGCNRCGVKKRIRDFSPLSSAEDLACGHDDYFVDEVAAVTVEKYAGVHLRRFQ